MKPVAGYLPVFCSPSCPFRLVLMSCQLWSADRLDLCGCRSLRKTRKNQFEIALNQRFLIGFFEDSILIFVDFFYNEFTLLNEHHGQLFVWLFCLVRCYLIFLRFPFLKESASNYKYGLFFVDSDDQIIFASISAKLNSVSDKMITGVQDGFVFSRWTQNFQSSSKPILKKEAIIRTPILLSAPEWLFPCHLQLTGIFRLSRTGKWIFFSNLTFRSFVLL